MRRIAMRVTRRVERVTRKVESTENTSLIVHRLRPVEVVALLEFFAFAVFFVLFLFDIAGISRFYFSVRTRKERGSLRVQLMKKDSDFPILLSPHFSFAEVVLGEGQLMLTPLE
jgi:hypothetical protein